MTLIMSRNVRDEGCLLATLGLNVFSQSHSLFLPPPQSYPSGGEFLLSLIVFIVWLCHEILPKTLCVGFFNPLTNVSAEVASLAITSAVRGCTLIAYQH